MPEEKFNYEEFAQSMYEQSLELMPEDISAGDKEYIAAKIKQFVQMSAEAMQSQYPNYSSNIIIFVSQVIAEWTYHKGVDIIHANIPKEYRNDLLQKVAFTAYQTLDENIKKGTPQGLLLERIAKNIKNDFCKLIDELYKKKCITKDVAQKAMELSNINDMLKGIKEPIADDDINTAANQEIRQMQESQTNYWTNYINDNPNDPEGYFNRGYLLACNGADNDIILSDFNKAIELNPNYVEAYKYKAYIYEFNGDYEKIIPEYKKIVEIEPTIENYDFYLRYLNTYIENGSQIALKVCEKIFSSFPLSAKLYELRGSTYYNLKDYDNAIADYKKAVEMCPDEDTCSKDNLKMVLKQIEQEKIE